MRCGNGILMDAETNELLDSVHVVNLTGPGDYYTDSTGVFDVCNKFGGCVPDCPDIEIQFSKEGYKTKVSLNPISKEGIFLEKE